jgi:hypothetical protein
MGQINSGTAWYSGQMDEVRIYNRGLTSNEIWTMAHQF